MSTQDTALRQSDIDRVLEDGVDSFHSVLYFHMSQLLAEHPESFNLTWEPVTHTHLSDRPPYQAKFRFKVEGLLPFMTVNVRETSTEKCVALEAFVAAKARRFKRNKTTVTLVPGSAAPETLNQRTPVRFEVLVSFE